MRYSWLAVGMTAALVFGGCRNKQAQPCSSCGAAPTTSNYAPMSVPMGGVGVTGPPIYNNPYVTSPNFDPNAANVAPSLPPTSIPTSPIGPMSP